MTTRIIVARREDRLPFSMCTGHGFIRTTFFSHEALPPPNAPAYGYHWTPMLTKEATLFCCMFGQTSTMDI